MKKYIISFIILLFAAFWNVSAQETKSYAASSCMTSLGAQPVPPNMSMCLTFYDNYIVTMSGEKFSYRATNFDGSRQYYPVSAGNPALRTVGILVSADLMRVREVQQSTMMGMTMQLTYEYQYIGEGTEPAYNYSGAAAGGGGYSGGSSHSSKDWSQCSSCMGSGNCKLCGGSGKNAYTRDGRCHGCRHGKCPACDGKGGWYY